MATKRRRQKIYIIKAGHFIVWEKRTKCILLLDEMGQSQQIWVRSGKNGEASDNKKHFPMVTSEIHLAELAILLGDLFGLNARRRTDFPGTRFEAVFEFFQPETR